MQGIVNNPVDGYHLASARCEQNFSLVRLSAPTMQTCCRKMQPDPLKPCSALFCPWHSLPYLLVFSHVLLISGCEYPSFQQSPESVFVGHNTILHLCIYSRWSTFADGWFSCGLLIFATQSSRGTLLRWDSPWVYVL